MNQMGQLHPALPDDLLNFQYDPMACAVALGWPGATVEETRVQFIRDGEVLRFQPGAAGRPMRILTDLDPTVLSNTGSTASRQPDHRNDARGLRKCRCSIKGQHHGSDADSLIRLIVLPPWVREWAND
jgi:hypothetical protein